MPFSGFSSNKSDKTKSSAFDAHLVDLTAHATKSNLTYYVDAVNGLDTNDGLLAGTGHAFKTISKAVSVVPQIVNHAVTINVAAGTYVELIAISGYSGKGSITMNGGTSLATAVNFIVQGVDIENCACSIMVNGFIANSTTTGAFMFNVINCVNVYFKWCLTIATGTSLYGFVTTNSLVFIESCQCSNKQIALYTIQMSTVISSNWIAGTGNVTGLYSTGGSTIAKNGTQPQGTTAEAVATGGVISGGNKIQSGSGAVLVATAGTAVPQTITFPTAFTTAPNVVVGLAGSSALTAGYNNIVVTAITTTSFTISANSYVSQNLGFYWIATGN